MFSNLVIRAALVLPDLAVASSDLQSGIDAYASSLHQGNRLGGVI